jgi:hypothetical protein
VQLDSQNCGEIVFPTIGAIGLMGGQLTLLCHFRDCSAAAGG